MGTPTLQSSAMLLDLTISVYTGRRTDRQTASEITQSKGAKSNATSVQKYLFAGDDDLRHIQSMASATRERINKITLPWNDYGVRLVPTKAFFEVVRELEDSRTEFENSVADFLSSYRNKVSNAAFSLGALFNAGEYPSVADVARRFKFNFEFSPVPSAGDFRVDIPNEAMDKIRAQFSYSTDNKTNAAVLSLTERLLETVHTLRDRCTAPSEGPRPRLYEATLENAKELCDIAKGLNMFDDPDIEDMRVQLMHSLEGVDIYTLRSSDNLRDKVRNDMQEILNKFN